MLRISWLTARECDKLLKADGFVQRAVRDAQLLILQAGHHFPASVEAAAVAGGGGTDGARFFASSLNHTLGQLVRARAAWGHAPSSITLMGNSIPVPACSSFAEPLGESDGWLAASAVLSRRNKYVPRWQHMPRLNVLSRWLAVAHGASFVDIAAVCAPASRPQLEPLTYSRCPLMRPTPIWSTACTPRAPFTHTLCPHHSSRPLILVRSAPCPPHLFAWLVFSSIQPSARWPAGMMAKYTKGAGGLDEDCLHSCLPGPIDTWSQMLVEMLIARSAEGGLSPRSGRMANANGESEPVGGSGGRRGGGAARVRASGAGGQRFFAQPLSSWLRDRNSGASLETGCRGNACVRAEASHQQWWPFSNCTRRKYVTFCEGGNCQTPVYGSGRFDASRGNRVSEAALRLCDKTGLGCHNLSVSRMRAAMARELIR